MEDVKNLYNKIYKESERNLPGIWHWPNIVESLYLKQFLKHYNINGLILDAGCGVGLKMEHLKHYKVIGMDYSLEGLKVAKELKFPLVQASVHKLPFKDNVFDFVYSFEVLQHLPTWEYIESSFSEISRVLKRNGIFVTVNYRLGGRLKERYAPVKENGKVILPRWAFTKEDYEILAKKNSLKLIKCGTILNFKPRLIGRFPILKPILAYLDYLMFKFYV
jgi:Methylase involved in ubiquinone/menaquinone biosynthesis